jgi:hypothetical protein
MVRHSLEVVIYIDNNVNYSLIIKEFLDRQQKLHYDHVMQQCLLLLTQDNDCLDQLISYYAKHNIYVIDDNSNKKYYVWLYKVYSYGIFGHYFFTKVIILQTPMVVVKIGCMIDIIGAHDGLNTAVALLQKNLTIIQDYQHMVDNVYLQKKRDTMYNLLYQYYHDNNIDDYTKELLCSLVKKLPISSMSNIDKAYYCNFISTLPLRQ